MLIDIINVILWCFAVYVCAYDWSEIAAMEGPWPTIE